MKSGPRSRGEPRESYASLDLACWKGIGIYRKIPPRRSCPDRDIRWYRTGDIVIELPDGNYKFLGRRDRMIKKRGYRIELGEIEVALYRHPAIKEAAVLAFPDDDGVPDQGIHKYARRIEVVDYRA